MELVLPVGPRLGKTVLELHGVTKSLGGKRLFADLELVVQAGERIGVVGPNGTGKTTLLGVVLGRVAPDAGEVVVGKNTVFAELSQSREELRDHHTVLEEVAGDSAVVVLESGTISVRSFLRGLLFDDAFADTPVGALSGGERSRVQLAKLLRAGANFLVLDEPTNDLDLVTLGVLEEALAGFPGAALVVSHDRWFLDRIATSILLFEGDGRVTRWPGTASEAIARARATAVGAAEAPAAETPRPARRERPTEGPRRRTYRERDELAGMEAALLAAEGRVAEVEALLQDPAIYKERSAEVPALVAELDRARAEVERLYARWQELDALG